MLRKTYKNYSINKKLASARVATDSFASQNELMSAAHFNILKYKSSDTLCVLASGASINNITNEQWEFIKQNDSLGFNNWLLHEFVPTYFFYETDANTERHKWLNEIKFKNLAARAKDYQDTPIFFHYQPKRYIEINSIKNLDLDKNLYLQASFAIPGEDKEALEFSLNVCNEAGIFNRIYPCGYKRGSLTRILHFAAAAGYKNVVFFGADLKGSDYFFDSYKDANLPKGTIKPDLSQYVYKSKDGDKKQSAVHMTMDPNVHPLTMIDVINAFRKTLKKKGITIYTGSKESALYPMIGHVEELMR